MKNENREMKKENLKKMRKIMMALTAVLLLASPLGRLAAQPSGSPSALLAAIAQAQRPAEGETYEYTFRQTKHSPLLAADAVSTGSMTLSGTRSMQWRYSSPQEMTLGVSGDTIYTVVGRKRQPLSGTAARMSRGIVGMIAGLTDGASLTDERQFATTIETEQSVYRVQLVPKRRDMKRMMQRAVLVFDRRTLGIKSVRLIEADDSYTQIDFKRQ